MTRGERFIKFIEKYCVVPEGELVGQPVRLAPFQKKFFTDIYDNPHGTDTAILSIARKNAKTATIAFLVIGHLVCKGIAIQNSRILSGAMSKEQAAEVYNYLSKTVRFSATLSSIIRLKDSLKEAKGITMNTEYKAISADGKTAHGKSPIVAIIDEVGQVKGPQSEFIDAITTAQGAYESPLLIYISTQAQNDSDLFSVLIDDARKHKPKKTVCHVYEATPDCDVLDPKEWKKANPALGLFRSETDMRKQAEKAARMPSFENTFRNLNLNQRVMVNDPLFSRESWAACGKKPFPMAECIKFYGGLDLSGRLDLTAFILIGWHPKSETWNVYAFFWTPKEGLLDRAKKDRAPYDVWVKQGHLRTVPGKTVRYDFVAKEIGEIISELNELASIAYDRWRIEQFKLECADIGLELPLTEHGQGYKDMAPAIDGLEDDVLNGKLRHGNNPVLNMCAANAAISSDPAGNRKLDKLKTSGRIDGIVALAMAKGIAEKQIVVDGGGNLDDFINNPIVIG